jgi:hypothetical protein
MIGYSIAEEMGHLASEYMLCGVDNRNKLLVYCCGLSITKIRVKALLDLYTQDFHGSRPRTSYEGMTCESRIDKCNVVSSE